MSQRAWDREVRHFGGEQLNAFRDTARVTFKDTVRDALMNEPRTAEEIASSLRSIYRCPCCHQVEPQLKQLVDAGEAVLEYRRGEALYRRIGAPGRPIKIL